MISAREIIAAATYESWENIPAASTRIWDVYCDKLPGGAHHFRKHADASIEALTAAGFRILAPDELDPATVERCAQVAEGLIDSRPDWSEEDKAKLREVDPVAAARSAARVAIRNSVDAIRTLTGGNNGR